MSSLINFNVAFDVIPNLRQVAFHAIGVFLVDNFQKFFELRSNLGYLVVRIGVEQDFLQQVVVLVQHTLGYAHVAFEGRSWCILMLHDGSKDKGADEGDTQRVSHGLIVLLEGVFVDVET